MSRFEYLSVLISIVIALGISEMASSWGHLLRVRARVRPWGRCCSRSSFLSSENAFRLPGILVAVGAAASQDERLHVALATVGSLLLLGFLVFGPV